MAPRSPQAGGDGKNMKIVAVTLTDPHALCFYERAFAESFSALIVQQQLWSFSERKHTS
jgi:hypothetical protein